MYTKVGERRRGEGREGGREGEREGGEEGEERWRKGEGGKREEREST